MNETATEALAKAMTEVHSGFSTEAVAYALISLAASTLTEEELQAAERRAEDLMSRRSRVR